MQGDVIFNERAGERCAALTNTVVAQNKQHHIIDIVYFYPSKASWRNGDRSTTCFAQTDSTFTASLVRPALS